MRIGLAPLRSTIAGILEFGLISTKPLENWSPSPIRISQASYSAPSWPSARSSSSSTVTFTPLGVASE
jgi:hypothetical protein